MNPGKTQGSDSALFQRIETSFLRQGMMQHLGARLSRVAPGEVEIVLPYSAKVAQQQGSFHGGAIGAVADVSAAYAGLTVSEEGSEVVSVEYKINFLSTRSGGALRAVGSVLKAGRRILVTRSEITHLADDGTTTLCAIMQQTAALTPKTY